MPNRQTPVHEAAIQATWMLQRIGRELRVARINTGKTQGWVARQLGTSQGRISMIERARCASVTVIELIRHAAVVGLRLALTAHPGGRRLLDAPQLNLLNKFRARLSPVWRWESEVVVPVPGDLRAADARISVETCSVVIEAITRFADSQGQVRSAQLKRRDLGADRLILLIAATHANRRAVREAGTALIDAFPISSRAALAALAAGRDPGGDAIILL